MPRFPRVLSSLVAWGLVACGADGLTPPPVVGCDGTSSDILSLAVFDAVTVRGDAMRCVALAGDGATYIIAPQLASATLPYGGYAFQLGAPEAALVARVSGPPSALGATTSLREVSGWDLDAQQRADQWLRDAEARPPFDRSRRTRGQRPSFSVASSPIPGSLRGFSVLSALTSPPAFDSITARLRFSGQNVLVYVDTAAQDAFNDGEIAAFGTLFDESIHATIRGAFGDPSDIDDNGRVIVVLTPVVNSLVTEAECVTSGYVRGFFYSHDLASDGPTANAGEVFYALVPDPVRQWSCEHTKSEVLAVIPPTFAHEFQHMISYAQHVIVRDGASETAWLNEGLSHLAEELGSLHFERKYPPPAGRADPSQIFPDSAAAFITPNLRYAHRFLFLSTSYSIISCAPGSFCSLPERAATWLFLRWLGDQKGDDVFRRLVQTPLAGAVNLEAAAGEPLSELIGDFVTALWADSIVGVRRDAVAPRHRFHSRNFRLLYKALYDVYGPVGGVGRPFPIEPATLVHDGSVTGTMRPGTFAMYRLAIPRGIPVALVRFAQMNGQPFTAATGAQLSILRVAGP